MKEKWALRRQFYEIRDDLGEIERDRQSKQVTKFVLEEVRRRGIQRLHCYVSFRTELSTHLLLKSLMDEGIEVWVPKVINDVDMSHHVLRDFSDLKEGYFGILEPQGPAVEHWRDMELVLVPGLAFTPQGYRLGYGKGYYDRFLGGLERAEVWGLAFDEQWTSDLPREIHDRRCQKVLSPKTIEMKAQYGLG